MRFPSRSPEATHQAARLLGTVIDDRGLVIALVGPLAAGKTVFAKGLAEGLGIDPEAVASPTFVVVSEYPAPAGRWLAHVDLYRVASRGELESAGFSDLLEPGAVVVVEWADRFADALPRDRLVVEIHRSDGAAEPAARTIHALRSGPVSEAALARWRTALETDATRTGPDLE